MLGRRGAVALPLVLLVLSPSAGAADVFALYLHEGGLMDGRAPTRSDDARAVLTPHDPSERFETDPLPTNATFPVPLTLNLTFQASVSINARLRAVLEVDRVPIAESVVNVTMATPGVSVGTGAQDVNVTFPFPTFPREVEPGRRLALNLTLLIPEGEQILVGITAPVGLVLVYDSVLHPGGFIAPQPEPERLPAPAPPASDPCEARPDACHHHHEHCAAPGEANATAAANASNASHAGCMIAPPVVGPDVPDTCETTLLCVATVGVGPVATDVRVVPFLLGVLGAAVLVALLLTRRGNHAPGAHVLPDSKTGRATVASGAGGSMVLLFWSLDPTLGSELAVNGGMATAGATTTAALYVILGGPIPPALARHPLFIALRGLTTPSGGAPPQAPAAAPPPSPPAAAAVASASYRRVPVLVAKEPIPTDDDLAAALARWNVRRGAP